MPNMDWERRIDLEITRDMCACFLIAVAFVGLIGILAAIFSHNLTPLVAALIALPAPLAGFLITRHKLKKADQLP